MFLWSYHRDFPEFCKKGTSTVTIFQQSLRLGLLFPRQSYFASPAATKLKYCSYILILIPILILFLSLSLSFSSFCFVLKTCRKSHLLHILPLWPITLFALNTVKSSLLNHLRPNRTCLRLIFFSLQHKRDITKRTCHENQWNDKENALIFNQILLNNFVNENIESSVWRICAWILRLKG